LNCCTSSTSMPANSALAKRILGFSRDDRLKRAQPDLRRKRPPLQPNVGIASSASSRDLLSPHVIDDKHRT